MTEPLWKRDMYACPKCGHHLAWTMLLRSLAVMLAVSSSIAFAGPASNVVRGVVREAVGQPVEMADVWLFNIEFSDAEALHALTDADGRFAIVEPDGAPFFPRSTYAVFVHKPGVGTAATAFEAENIPHCWLSLELRKCAPATVKITDPHGRPVAGARVRLVSFALHRGGGSPRMRGLVPPRESACSPSDTNAAGETTFETVAEGSEFSFTVDAPNFGMQQINCPAGDGEHSVRLLPAGKLAGRLVVDEPAKAAGSVLRMMVFPRDSQSTDLRPFGAYIDAHVDAAGRFEVPAVLAGDVRTYTVLPGPSSPYRLAKLVTASVAPGETTTLEIPLSRGTHVQGSVIDGDTLEPIEGARLFVSHSSRMMGAGFGSLVTDKKGCYKTYELAPVGQEFLQLDIRVGKVPAPYLPSFADVQVCTTPSNATDFEVPPILLKRGQMLTGTVVDSDGRPVPLARVQAAWMSPNPAVTGVSRFPHRRVFAETDGRGIYSLGPVDRDTTLALVAQDDSRASTQFVFLKPEAPNDGHRLSIDASAMMTCSGRILDEEGQPLGDVEVWLNGMGFQNPKYPSAQSLQAAGEIRMRTDGAGRFVLPHPVPRMMTYAIVVPPQGHEEIRLKLPSVDSGNRNFVVPDIVLKRKPLPRSHPSIPDAPHPDPRLPFLPAADRGKMPVMGDLAIYDRPIAVAGGMILVLVVVLAVARASVLHGLAIRIGEGLKGFPGLVTWFAGNRSRLLWAVTLLIAMPVIYVASFGPACGLVASKYLPPAVFNTVYLPLKYRDANACGRTLACALRKLVVPPEWGDRLLVGQPIGVGVT